MSASDKKKQRKAEQADALTQRQRREQAEAQAAKQKKTIYTIIGLVCAAAAIALLAWSSFSGVNKNATAVTVDGVDYSIADMQYYYYNSSTRNSYYNIYYNYGTIYGFDGSKGDGAQWLDESTGTTYADFFREAAVSNLKQTAALCKAAKEAGYSLSDAGKKIVDSQLKQVDVVCAQNNLTRSAYFNQMGLSEKVYVRNLTNDVLASEYYQKYADSFSYDDAALQAYYKDHANTLDSYDYRVFTVDGSLPIALDENGNVANSPTDEEKAAAMAAAKEKAEQAMAEILAASDKEKAFRETAPLYVAESSKDPYTTSDLSLKEAVLGNNLSSAGSNLAQWLMDGTRKNGDMTVLENSAATGYQVVMFLDRYLVEDPTVNIRHILIMPEIAEGAKTNSVGASIPTQEAMDAAKEKLEGILAEWEAGEKTAESFGALANEHSDDGGSNTKGGRYTYVYQGEMVPAFDAWIFDSSRKAGDTGLVENSGDDARYYGWHAIYFEGLEEPAWKGTAIDSKKNTDVNEWAEKLMDAVTAETTDNMSQVGAVNTAVPTPSATPDATETPAA